MSKNQEKLTSAKQALSDALRAGSDTGKIRAQIKELEAAIKADEQAETKRAAEARAAEEAKVAKAAETTLKAEKTSIATTAAVEGLAELLPDGEELAEVVDDPALADAARTVSQARLALDAANKRHQQAQQAAADLRDRINEKRAREAQIRRERLGGSDDGAAELHAISLDLDGLKELLTEAESNAAQQVPTAQRKQLSDAEAHLKRVKAKQVAATLQERARQAEAIFIEAHKALVEASMVAGATNRFTVYQPSQQLRFITHGTTN